MSIEKSVPWLLIHIQALRPSLTLAEARVADYILEHPKDVLECTLSDLAEKSRTSDASALRLIRKLDISGFSELKLQLAQSLVAPVKLLNSEIDEGDSISDLVRKVFGGIINTLTVTCDSVSAADLEKAADMLFNARQIFLAGLGNSASPVSDFEQKLLRLGRIVHSRFDAHLTLIDIINTAGPEDVCFAVSHSGRSKLVIDAAAMCRERGAKIIALTDNVFSPLRDMADVSLCTMSSETRYNQFASSSKIAQYAICNVLYTIMAYKHESLAVDYITKIEKNMQMYKL